MPRLISINDAARELSVSADTVRRLIRAKQIPAVRVARRVMIPTGELERLTRKGTINSQRGSQ